MIKIPKLICIRPESQRFGDQKSKIRMSKALFFALIYYFFQVGDITVF